MWIEAPRESGWLNVQNVQQIRLWSGLLVEDDFKFPMMGNELAGK